jgi:hypothetical protein
LTYWSWEKERGEIGGRGSSGEGKLWGGDIVGRGNNGEGKEWGGDMQRKEKVGK